MAAGVWSRPDRQDARSGVAGVPAVALEQVPEVSRTTVSPAGCREQILRELAGGKPSGLVLQGLFLHWFRSEGDLWLEFKSMESDYPESTGTLTTAFFSAWAWKDCRAASMKLAGASLLARTEAVTAVWRVACAQGNAECIVANRPPNLRDWSPLERLAERDPVLAQKVAPPKQPYGGPAPEVLAIARGWAATGDPMAVQWAATFDNAVFREACLALYRRDPAALDALPDALRAKGAGDDVLACLLKEHGTASPMRVAAWLDPFASLGDVITRARSDSGYLTFTGGPAEFRQTREPEWSPADPQAALEELAGQPQSAARDVLRHQILDFWNQSEPDAAGAYADANGLVLPGRKAVQIVSGLAFPDALRVVMPENGLPDWNGLSSAVGRAACTEPEAATAFLMEHLPEISRGEGGWRVVLVNTMMQWSGADVPAATAWAATLPEGQVRDAAIGGVAQALEGYDPASAILWMATMQKPDSGSTTLSQVSRKLSEQMGPVGARRTVEQMDLPEPVRAAVLAEFEKSRP